MARQAQKATVSIIPTTSSTATPTPAPVSLLTKIAGKSQAPFSGRFGLVTNDSDHAGETYHGTTTEHSPIASPSQTQSHSQYNSAFTTGRTTAPAAAPTTKAKFGYGRPPQILPVVQTSAQLATQLSDGNDNLTTQHSSHGKVTQLNLETQDEKVGKSFLLLFLFIIFYSHGN